MSTKTEPAFPWQQTDNYGNPLTNFSGMTLRDYFAAKAMQGMCQYAIDKGVRESLTTPCALTPWQTL